MRNHSLLALLFVCIIRIASAQEINPRPLTMDEYNKAKAFDIKNLDAETYVKFDNTYILDRYEMRKPYFITGDDGLKKRIDLYKLVAKAGMQELGLMIFYTTEKGKVHKALLPNFTADASVWERYFEDIHAIDKEEKNFVLKLSYILSKEVGFQLYKSLNQGKDLSKESATYGNDICFPGHQLVELSNGMTKQISELRAGDEIVTVNPVTKQSSTIHVKKLIEHGASNYAVTRLTLVKAQETTPHEITLTAKVIEATPNHPMLTTAGTRSFGEIAEKDVVLCHDNNSGRYEHFTVLSKHEYAAGLQKVYNIEGDTEGPFVMNGVMVLQK